MDLAIKNYITLHQTFGIKTLEIPIFVGRSVIIIICKILAGKIDGTRWTQIDDMKCDVTFAEWVSMFELEIPPHFLSKHTHELHFVCNQTFISKMQIPTYSCWVMMRFIYEGDFSYPIKANFYLNVEKVSKILQQFGLNQW